MIKCPYVSLSLRAQGANLIFASRICAVLATESLITILLRCLVTAYYKYTRECKKKIKSTNCLYLDPKSFFKVLLFSSQAGLRSDLAPLGQPRPDASCPEICGLPFLAKVYNKDNTSTCHLR